MLADHRGTRNASAASSENARLMEMFELQTDAGPCVDCYRGAVAVVNADLDANAERWLTTQLQTALNSRISIEQAKGVLAERHQIKLEEAFTILRRHARDNNLRMSGLARDVANGSLLPIGDETPAARVVDSPESSSGLWPVHPPDHCTQAIRARRRRAWPPSTPTRGCRRCSVTRFNAMTRPSP